MGSDFIVLSSELATFVVHHFTQRSNNCNNTISEISIKVFSGPILSGWCVQY